MQTVKVTTIGDSIGIVFPPEVTQRLRVVDGDELQFSETANGVELIARAEDFLRQMTIVEEIMEKRKDVLRKLAE